MRPRTGARSDRVSATLFRLLVIFAAMLAALGLGALLIHTPLPLWAWIVAGPDMLALAVLAAARLVTPRPLYRPFGG
jgi:hypothetical protein